MAGDDESNGHAEHHPTGLKRWLLTTDHKDIGILYIVTAFFFFILGGILALLMRAELAAPGPTIMDENAFNQAFSMHGTTMIFLWIIPVLAGFGNYFVPLMIKAKDMAFPRVNALSYWLIPPAGLMIWAGALFPNIQLADVGWTGYPPLSTQGGTGIDLWILGLHLLGVASTLGAVNFLVTILKMRGPGIRIHNMPLFVWAQMTTSLLVLFATPVLTMALTMLFMDRNFGTGFFAGAAGGDVVLWQHLFWFYSHPAVYIMVVPAMGIISEVLPKFARRPIFGYKAIAYSTLAIGFLGFTVWAHHMFTTGIDPRVRAVYMINTMIIGVPTGVKIFNWIATLWGGRISFRTPMLFGLGFLALFVIGGIDGVFMASIPVDYALHDTYWVVSHIHYVLFGGSVMGVFAGIYYWFPRMTGRMYNETLGVLHWITTVVGINLTFFFMHNLGLQGMPRRVFDYLPEYTGYNYLATVGAFILGAGQLFFFYNVVHSARHGRPVSGDPWGGNDHPEWDDWTPEHGIPNVPPVTTAPTATPAAEPEPGQEGGP